MTPRMKSKLTLSLLLSIGLTTCFTDVSSFAKDMKAMPVPSDRQPKSFNEDESEMTPAVSRFHRRLDYREEEKAKAKEAEEAQKKALANQHKAQTEQLTGVKKIEQDSINANNRGVALGQQRRWTEAIAAHEEAVQLDPRNKQFRINLSAARCAYGQEKFAAGDYTAAANLFRKSLAAAQDNGLAGKQLVATMKKMGRDPNSVEVRMELGDQLSQIGDLEGATVEYEAAMQLEPSARTFIKMGDMALRYSQVSTAANWYRQAIVKDPNYGPAHRQLGMLSLYQRDYTGAASSLRKALVLDPKDAAAGQTLVEIWRRQVASNPLLAENHLGLAGALQLTGDFQGADNEYRKLEALDAKNSGLEPGRASLARAMQHAEAERHRVAADTLYSQGLHREALAEIGRAVNMEPRNAKYQFLFAECLEANGDYAGAHQAYLTCVLMDPENNKEAAARIREMQKSTGGSNINVGQQASQIAAQYQQQQARMIQQIPAPASVQNSSANVPMQVVPGTGSPMQQMQQTQQTQPMQAQQSAPQPQVQQTRQNMADAAYNDGLAKVTDLESQKNYDAAIATLRQMLSANLQNAELHHRLAVNLLATGQIAEAISEFRTASALRPDKKDYAGDLARAMAIHKRSLENTSNDPSVASTTEVAK